MTWERGACECEQVLLQTFVLKVACSPVGGGRGSYDSSLFQPAPLASGRMGRNQVNRLRKGKCRREVPTQYDEHQASRT